MKTLDDNFRDWHAENFGFGYGSGEAYILPALKAFLAAVQSDGSYDHTVLEQAVTPPVAWLLINALCSADVIEYGMSPRFAWLSKSGKALKAYTDAHTADELYDVVCRPPEDYVNCGPNCCNCGPNGYDPEARCANPFWSRPYECAGAP